MVWVGNPVFMPMAVSYFAGLGSVMFVGGGSAVIVGSPVAMPMAVMVRACLIARLPACLRACLPACAPACLPACLRFLLTHLPSFIPSFLPSLLCLFHQAWSGPSMSMMTDDVMNPESTFGVSDVAWRGVVGVICRPGL